MMLFFDIRIGAKKSKTQASNLTTASDGEAPDYADSLLLKQRFSDYLSGKKEGNLI